MIPLRNERYSGSLNDKFTFSNKSTEENDVGSTTMTAPALDYHQESLPKVSEWTGTGKYLMSFHVDETDLTNFWPRWENMILMLQRNLCTPNCCTVFRKINSKFNFRRVFHYIQIQIQCLKIVLKMLNSIVHSLKVVRDSEHVEKFRKNSKTTNFAIILSHEIYKCVR